jgi:apolipoprotein N-acyltransferase
LAWFLATPGLLKGDGVPALGVLFVTLWSLAAARPGPRQGWIEWFLGGLGLVLPTYWMAYVFPPAPAMAALGLGLYAWGAGGLLRALLRRGVPLVLAAGWAWVALETLRDWLEPPLGFGWLRLGHLLGAWPPLLGAARWVGVEGLSLALATLGAGLAAGFMELTPAAAPDQGDGLGRRAIRRPNPLALGLALLPLLAVGLAAILSAPPPTAPGPNLLLLQPNVDVWAKGDRSFGLERLKAHLDLTRAGLEAAAAAGQPVDLVVWPETNLPFDVGAPGLSDALANGARFAPWRGPEWRPELLRNLDGQERAAFDNWIWPALTGVPAFLSGVERWTAADNDLRRQNAASLWQRQPGVARQDSLKLALAPGGETVFGLQSWGFLRRRIEAQAGYLPDLLAGEESAVLRFSGRDGRPWRVLATVCFDNAHQYPYLNGFAREDADFSAVLSNEAWYHGELELDQMLAFSRAIAVMTGRSLVRSTNDGLTLALGPDGRELARLRVNGRDRGVSGSLAVQVPVPQPGAGRPPYGALAPWLRGLLIGLPLLLLLGRRTKPNPGASGE